MNRLLYLLFFLFSAITTCAQPDNTFLTDARGLPVVTRSSYVTEGTPYLNEQFFPADITSTNGKKYTNVKTRVNIFECQVEYLNDEGKELIATLPILKIHFRAFPRKGDSLSSLTLESPGRPLNQKNTVIYAVIDSGRVPLMKKIAITSRDEKKYGDATITRHFEKTEADYVLMPNGEFIKLEKGKDFIVGLLKDKKTEIEAFIAGNKIKCKSTSDFKQILHYYNSL